MPPDWHSAGAVFRDRAHNLTSGFFLYLHLPRCGGGVGACAGGGVRQEGGFVFMLVCDFSECPFELMSFCDESAAMRCLDCPYARFVSDTVFDDADVLYYSGFGVSPF